MKGEYGNPNSQWESNSNKPKLDSYSFPPGLGPSKYYLDFDKLA
jgi:hypothetical protein